MMAPSDWTPTTTGDLIGDGKLEVGDGYRAKNAEFGPTGIPFLRIRNLDDGHLVLDEADLFPEEHLARVGPKISQPGDCVIAPKATIGRMAYLDEAAPRVLYSPQVSYWRVLDRAALDSRFIGCWLRGKEFETQAFQTESSTSMADYINLRDQRQMRVTMPPLDVQRKIAAVLAAYDELIENNLRRIEILEETAQVVYREWFVNFRFPGHEAVALVDSPLGPIPDGWDKSTVGEAAENFDRLRKPLSKMQRAEMQGAYPYYGAAKVFDYVNDYIFDGEYLLVAEDGSVVTLDGHPVLQLASGKFWANNHTHILRGSAVSTHHLYLALSRVQIMGYVTGAAQPKITQGALNRVPLLVPPPPTRDQFDQLIRPMFGLRQNLLVQNENLRSTRDLLLPRLVSGEIDLSELEIETDWLAS